ncbi:MAG: hypothetical protein GTN80_07450 [Nitrososphaeria archaeon]|nr:hypothetical protein [Nitrososphaeria archaeon]NIQ33460.1 hypothetical protein [Nitrososphaeria archaeon]
MKSEKKLEFEFRTGKVIIDYDKCIAPECGFACVKADRLYGRSVLKIEGSRPILSVSREEAKRLCNECLGCELDCEFYGNKAIRIELPLFGLNEYRKRMGIPV